MSRPIDERRPQQLREAIAKYFIKHGLAGLSLRPLARAVGSSPRGLLYHFGSKREMVNQVLADIRSRQQVAFAQITRSTLGQECWEVWRQMSSPESEPTFRLFFEIYGLALRHPRQYQDFLSATVEGWLTFIAAPLERDGYARENARALATLVLAGLRGFMLDLCATHDRKRINRAVDLWLKHLDAKVFRQKVE